MFYFFLTLKYKSKALDVSNVIKEARKAFMGLSWPLFKKFLLKRKLDFLRAKVYSKICKDSVICMMEGKGRMSFKQHDEAISIIVEGNVGAGKSSFLKILKDSLHIPIIYEPHEQWQNVDNEHNLLDKFYKDTQRWAYTFQSYAFVTRVIEQEKFVRKNPNSLHILERSVYSDRYCFAKNCFEMGAMNALEWKLYQEWFSWFIDNYTIIPKGFIYLQTSPETCFNRMKKRNRSEETAVSLEYLTLLHDKHERWLVDRQDLPSRLKSVPVLILSCDADFVHDKEQQKHHLDNVVSFVQSVHSPYKREVVDGRLCL